MPQSIRTAHSPWKAGGKPSSRIPRPTGVLEGRSCMLYPKEMGLGWERGSLILLPKAIAGFWRLYHKSKVGQSKGTMRFITFISTFSSPILCQNVKPTAVPKLADSQGCIKRKKIPPYLSLLMHRSCSPKGETGKQPPCPSSSPYPSCQTPVPELGSRTGVCSSSTDGFPETLQASGERLP